MHKEIWTKHELKDFGIYCNGDVLNEKFALNSQPKSQQEMNVTMTNRLNHLKHLKRIRAIKSRGSRAKFTGDELSTKGSVWSDVPPSPRAANEQLIWKSRLHA